MPTSVSQYIFGNSLVNFSEGNTQTNIAVWMDAMAEAAGNSYAISGGYGFLRQFADRDTPGSEWGFNGVEAAWDSESQGFDQADLSSVVITPANFIQDQAPGANYAGDIRSPVDATLDVIADVQAAQPEARIYIYEGWADMAGFVGDVPAQPAALDAYHAYNTGAYHNWFTSYVDQINAADPDAQATLIPVGSVLSELMTTVLSDVSPQSLYVDTAPHGTETLYFLASMVTYSAVYGEAPPSNYNVPGNIDPAVAALYPELAQAIFARVSEGTELPIFGDSAATEDAGFALLPDTEDAADGAQSEPEPEQGQAPSEGPLAADSTDAGTARAVTDYAAVTANTAALLDVLANDLGDLRLVHVDAPTTGATTLTGDGVVYSAADVPNTADSFHYTALDANGQSHEAQVNVNVLLPSPPLTEETAQTAFVAAETLVVVNDETLVEDGWDDSETVFLGALDVSQDGTYSLSFYSDDPVMAWLDGQDLALTREDGSLLGKTDVSLEAGRHVLEIAYTQGVSADEIALVVDGPGQVELSVPGGEDTGAALINLLQIEADPWEEDLPEEDADLESA